MSKNPISPLAPTHIPDLPVIAGVRLCGLPCAIKYAGRIDVMLAELAEGTTVAGVFTRSKTASAPVEWCRTHVKQGSARAVVVNSGNSNAFTGKRGEASVAATVASVAAAIGCKKEEVFIASTGVIGEPLPHEKITSKMSDLKAALKPESWVDAAAAILTTDTFPKRATRSVMLDGVKVTINGIAKGSGMIAPDMATMLGFIFTDANITAPLLQQMTSRCNDASFNATTVDGDTSTSDTVLVFATGKAAMSAIEKDSDPRARAFEEALQSLMLELAHLIVKDGEGAQKFVAIEVNGAENDTAARKIGLAIANSPLVKTAIAGEDPNWGRVVMAVGKSGELVDRDKLGVRIGGVQVARDGEVVAGYDEAPVKAHFKTREIHIAVDIGLGSGKATVWTCDLTHQYIAINADYRS